MQKWEYTWFTCNELQFTEADTNKKIFSGKNGYEHLCEAGQKGWELVDAVAIPKDHREQITLGGYISSGGINYIKYILKRPVEE